MKYEEANIEIRKAGNKIATINVVMPIWEKYIAEDSIFSVAIPLFGIKTWAKNQKDMSVAVQEAIGLFAINCERFERGLVAELKSLGWQVKSQDKDTITMCFCVSDKNEVFHEVLETGDQTIQSIDLSTAKILISS